MITENLIAYEVVEDPNIALPSVQPVLPDEVYEIRLKRTLQEMSKRNLKYLMIYADREHYGNFVYLTGYGPRFEEAILVLDQSGKSYTLLGNECLGMAKQSRIPTEGILFHEFSLPNQPIHDNKTLKEILRYIGVDANVRVGMAG